MYSRIPGPVSVVSIVIVMLLCACGGGSHNPPALPAAQDSQILQGVRPAELPAALPEDGLQPWESLDARGFVDPATARRSSAINGNSEFLRGADAWQTGGSAVPAGQGLDLQSGDAGSGQLSFASYRFPLAGENPATISTDLNLRLRSDATASSYMLGVANYTTGRWDWSGPFTDGRIRLPLSAAASADYISPLGNAFLSVLVHDGSALEVVGLALNQFDPADTNAPPAPTGLNLASVSGGIELTWNSVIAQDLAGYAIYWSKSSFSNPHSAGVRSIGYLEGGTRHVLSGLEGEYFVAVSAVDLNGNESTVSGEGGNALPGSTPVIQLLPAASSGILNSGIGLLAGGADSYDWDLDGDGVYEVTGDATGIQLADTGRAGIIRPAVRASSDGGTAVALGAVSLIIAPDLPPVALLAANRSSGIVTNGDLQPLLVDFDASASYDDDGSLEYAWDTNGDGSFDPAGSSATASGSYGHSGIYNAAVRVVDSAGQMAQALYPVTVLRSTGFEEHLVSHITGNINARMAVVAGHPVVVAHLFNPGMGINGIFYMRARDTAGEQWEGPVPILPSQTAVQYMDIAEIAGHPALLLNRPGGDEIRYLRCNNAEGTSASNWPSSPVLLAQNTPVTQPPRLLEVNGQPAATWVNAVGGLMYYVRATGPDGTGQTTADWTIPPISVAAGPIGFMPDFAMISGKPALAWFDASTEDILFLRSTSPSGHSNADWPLIPQNVSVLFRCNGRVNLAEIRGLPGISIYDPDNDSLGYFQPFAIGDDGFGWGPLPVNIESGTNPGMAYHDLAEIDGLPAVVYHQGSSGSYCLYRQALDEFGNGFRNAELLGPLEAGESMSQSLQLMEHNGLPAALGFSTPRSQFVFISQGTSL
ncbi:MAG: PKD domain-containing protein [bacterium]